MDIIPINDVLTVKMILDIFLGSFSNYNLLNIILIMTKLRMSGWEIGPRFKDFTCAMNLFSISYD